jgi:two-component system, NarL family, invasion response regulator UvrY
MRFLIADDHAIVRKGLVQMLREEFHSVEVIEVSNGNDALEHHNNEKWDLILLDISMAGRNGIETLKQMRASDTKTPILMLSTHSEEQYAIRVLKAGASGFLNKESATEELLAAVHKVLNGHRYVSISVAEKLAESIGDHNGPQPHTFLSDRETHVFELIAGGKTVSEIALIMSLSVSTISTYRMRILEKLSLKNNAEVARYAFDHNLH